MDEDENAPALEDYMEHAAGPHGTSGSTSSALSAAHVEKGDRRQLEGGALEAFIESYHAIATHPQLLPYQAIENSQYDIWGDHVSRTITAYGVPNPSDAPRFTEQDSMDNMMKLAGQGREPGGGARPDCPGETGGNHPAGGQRSGGRGPRGADHHVRADGLHPVPAVPQFRPWAGHGTIINYRHRPNGDDVDSCIMDIYLLTRYPEGSEPPEDAPTVRLGIDEPFKDAAEVLGAGLANVFDQDGANLPQVQKGMKASKKGTVTLGNYQEVRIRHFHQTLDKYLNA